MLITFDVNGCLVDENENPRPEILALLQALRGKNKIYIWSGNGFEYANKIAKKIGIDKYIDGILSKYGTFKPDLAIDDQEVELGKLNLKV